MARNPVGKLLLFGATGDLAQRMLLPSLYGLHADGLLADGVEIIGAARSEHDDDGYRAFAKAALEKYLSKDRNDADTITTFLERLSYQAMDLSDAAAFAPLAKKVGPNGIVSSPASARRW